MFKSHRKLSRRFSLDIMLLATPIFILSLGIVYVQSRKMIHQKVAECVSSTLNTAQHRVRNYMNAIETAANSNVWMLEENFRPDSLQSISNRIVRLNPSVVSSSIFVVPDMFKAYGRLFSLYTINENDTVVTYHEPDYDYLDKAFYTHPVNTGNACWIDPYKDNAQWGVDPNKAIATYCRPIRQDDGRIVGVVTTDFLFKNMAEMLNEGEQPYPGAYYMLLSGDGRFLIYPDSTRLFRKSIFSDADPSVDRDIITLGYEMTAGKQGVMHTYLNGELYHVGYQPVSGTDWSLALVCPDYDAMKSYYNLGYIIIVLLVIGLLVILLLCNHVVKQISRPINNLINFTQKITKGQFDDTIPATTQEGIVYKLQNCFEVMQQSLNTRLGSLRKDTDEIRLSNEALNKAKQQAEDTVRKKNLYIQHITQQIRMPLNVITGFAHVLRESSTNKSMITDEELSSITDMMKTNAISMNQMMMLLYDAMETDATETVSFVRTDEVSCNMIARECINHTLRHFPQANIQLETELQDATYLLTNRIYLICILYELLYNAAKYTDGKHIVLRVTQTEATVCFTIQDVGPGLPADLPDFVLESFTKRNNQPEDIGLGLPLAKRHALSLGGNLVIDKEYHDGCRIVVEMPK